MKELIANLIVKNSLLFGFDPTLALSIAQVESGMNPSAIGSLGEVGLFQLRPEYFNDIFTVNSNINSALKHLIELKQRCAHKRDHTFIVCYNVGVTGGKRVKDPKNHRYYKRVMREYAKLKRNRSNRVSNKK